MKILFVVPYPVNEAASQRFRYEQYLSLLQAQSIKYKLAPFWNNKTWAILYKPGKTWQKVLGLTIGYLKRVMLLPRVLTYDFVFIHREATPLGPPWFEWLVSRVFRKRIIFDFDDAIWMPNISPDNSLVAKYKWHNKTADICRWSYKVSCGNSFLQNYALKYNSNTILLPTTIDTRNLHNKTRNQHTEKLVIGWTGSHSTLPYLKLLEPVLRKLEEKYDFDFLVIADTVPELKLGSFKYKVWQKETEIEDLLSFNIGVMPLPDTDWAKGKCAFKALQYMALGIPAVVSEVGANTTAVPHGTTGFVCSSQQDWYTYLEQLLLNPELRTQIGKAGQLWVEENYSTKAHQKTFLKLFT
ncbi:glycosyltransferase family 4 protein [Pontibacter vulgaris]|uniref:glycosyltransferase family 4 protein n=1 Tax=Pontibacter vulgaris TaxID=2905679 RepID=UPI001FA6C5FB|nr:glycosyltransferase family 4 protein [Pontibacter vulgaris]